MATTIHQARLEVQDGTILRRGALWIRALRNRHWLVGILSLVVLLLSVAVPPLSAQLFTDQGILVETATILNVTHRYNALDTAPVNWIPILDTVAAVGLFGGASSPWTNAQFAFDHFDVPSQMTEVGSTAVVAGKITGYSADTDCVVLAE
ncbi:hypothetical protein MFIFM68171_07016 [Madurella fahalii]|uniref:Uncharacterized protein n=1 Tax=Madurella fahalii TaxID=1157608 RepID=A0ABQ0GGA7_9PEZI